jgi:phage FluMu protein Com
MAARRCASCSKFLPGIKGRGRPALRCAKCRAADHVITIRECRGCNVTLPAPEGRGRPPVKCVECRSTKALVKA